MVYPSTKHMMFGIIGIKWVGFKKIKKLKNIKMKKETRMEGKKEN